MSRPTSSWKKKALGGLVLASLLGFGCEPPPVVPTADGRQNTHTARIEGSLVVQSRARGNAVVFLYDADRPPPPQGTGRPIAFTVIPAEQVFGPALTTNAPGPFTAPFTFSLVTAGRYTLRGFIDADTCGTAAVQPCHRPDFIPWYGVTSEPNAGDVGGAAVDPTTGAPLTLEVTADADGHPQPLTGVSVSFSDTARVPVDRPAFQVVGDRTLGNTPKVLRLQPLQMQNGAVDQRTPGFLVGYVDANRDGVPDDANGDNVPDFSLRVVVRKLHPTLPGVEENDVDRNGVPDAEGEDYLHADGTLDGKPDVVVLAARLMADPLITALTDEQGQPRMQPVVVPELQVAVAPQALDARNPAAPAPLKDVPRGRYAVVVIQPTGQTWRVPNELDPALAPGVGLPPVESQAFYLEVP
ncbi:hypothetical protein HPC49_35990 [Pyxidicoccus fallax]|uniref:Lipoprotein n=1 Tax=Pyxidicoccus fallax TaxID=394095 RepID=A0A848L963_9BACT|nr:hypothetical protein [Pyxidicoccus fallax]NMO15369.1 hypothetical protein [Pyxidicoccus fallax]NPC83613.1 hypothetical protein [Pyxidicoccus fallax]